MNWLENRIFRVISGIVLIFFCWTFGGIFDVVAYAAKSDQQSAFSGQQSLVNTQQSNKQRPEGKLQKTINDIAKIIEEVEKLGGLEDKKAGKEKLKGKKAEIEVIDVEIRTQFAVTEDKIKDLSDTIKQRHRDFVAKYEENLNELKTNLEAIERYSAESLEFEEAIGKANLFLEKVKPPKKHIPLDPNKLPHRTPEVKKPELIERQPDKKKFKLPRFLKQNAGLNYSDEFENSNPSPILIASNGSLSGLLDSPTTDPQSSTPILLAQADPPTDADLAETIEVQFTPEIIAKAEELENKPVLIYNWVRNNIEFVPTYGSIQGADLCLQTKLCNAFDTASLLIALLRASGIHARYVYGTIELPIEKVMNWVGNFTDPNSALTLIASGGIPGLGLTSGGEIVAVQMKHVWIEAYVPYGPYSGRLSELNPTKTWVPLDPSFKQYTYTEGVDLQTAVPFDAESFIDQIQSTATINEAESYVTNIDSNYIQTTLTNYQTQIQDYIDQNMPGATVEDILGKKEIKKQELGILPATLPYKKIVIGDKYSEIPDNLRHKVTFTVLDPYFFETSLSYTTSIPELTGKRITLSYTPATTTDQQIIDSYGGIYNVPAYLVNMKPQLKVEGIVEATGGSIGLGNQQTFGMRFSGPNITTDVVSNNAIAGAYYGIGLNPYRISKELVGERKIKLEAQQDTVSLDNIYTDEYIGEILYTTAIAYFLELDIFEDIIAQSYKVAKVKQVSEAIVAKDLSVTYSFGIPLGVKEEGLIIDVDRNIYSPVSKSGDNTKSQEFMVAVGQIGSGMEHGIFEQMYNKTGTSAIKALSVANDQGIPIYTIDTNNIADVLPVLQISNDVKADIQNSVNAGKVVTVSKTDVTVDTWTGVGYIILEPTTGAAAYMISGGFAGGGADVSNDEIVEKLFKYIAIAITLIAIAELLEVLSIIAIEGIALLAALPLIGQIFVIVLFVIIIVSILYAIWLLYDNVIRGQQEGRRIYRHSYYYLYA